MREILRISFLLVSGVCFLLPAQTWSQVPAGKQFQLTPDEKVNGADVHLGKMKDTLKLALKRLKKARANKDIIQLNCVNEKLTQVKGLLRISEQARASLGEAMGQRDFDLVDHEFTKVSIAAMRIDNLRLQVEGCVGELSQYTGSTVADLVIDPSIRSDEPALAEYTPVFEALNVERPPAVSGSQ
jgi:hypothetical protein